MKEQKIGFIGGGNMAASLIGGLIADGVPPGNLWVADPNAEQRERLATGFRVNVSPDNDVVVDSSEVIVLAVKPQVLGTVCRAIAARVQVRHPLVISVAAGVRIADIERWLGGNPSVVRTMPNTPALVQSGATALYANTPTTDKQKEQAEAILRAVGLTLWLENEAQMDAVTALSGSGPAYFFLVMEAMEQAGVALGLSQETARLLALQTAFGASKMALESADDAATLRRKVTSPGGTTEQALRVLEEGNLRGLFEKALRAAASRSGELAVIFGEQEKNG